MGLVALLQLSAGAAKPCLFPDMGLAWLSIVLLVAPAWQGRAYHGLLV
jgi:hypothetical protein